MTWILYQEALGYAPLYSQVCSVIVGLLKSIGDNKPLGKNWIDGFKRRNPSIKAKIGCRIEAFRFNSFTPRAINWYLTFSRRSMSGLSQNSLRTSTKAVLWQALVISSALYIISRS